MTTTINKTIPVEVGQFLYSYKDGLIKDSVDKIEFNYCSCKESFLSEKIITNSYVTITLSDKTVIDLSSLGSTYFTSKEELLKHIVNLVI